VRRRLNRWSSVKVCFCMKYGGGDACVIAVVYEVLGVQPHAPKSVGHRDRLWNRDAPVGACGGTPNTHQCRRSFYAAAKIPLITLPLPLKPQHSQCPAGTAYTRRRHPA
jgi:hypothetical protein